ncbi:hypothetical protein FOXG_20260 [Fusarium oxysporum f. sp. lycopersici 4287]|uniref:Uncharacterized protein n=2 Tax=Fusarium oxysporum TaxID=5507 RepID=A0A0J9VFV1_FUSO4|nr:hypothetical protein FOXG_20260 [Fusarium oxysporum f. sp. lycopersici 4287]XP_018247805.1 hypothetical protein FOXG_20260 [Fusarium oxysporum f. sp. lycopersici 4287]XP_018247806.1 hypothetical protein FOXG_20260 [Fusarium oxysporum f. sp. lycopersici 4287]EXK39931.1 hypothetical protein FOMG_07002 [Fusarium oxysporum f. sp. melonis 26406]EXK39932.1 hypothetical protein FOMG_07002 [Fusarium oxysporum f. sp. melonis 26406]EXK39933.1 hypothetical protein FOMG_07002 [Fusarium oxysporum f. sp.
MVRLRTSFLLLWEGGKTGWWYYSSQDLSTITPEIARLRKNRGTWWLKMGARTIFGGAEQLYDRCKTFTVSSQLRGFGSTSTVNPKLSYQQGKATTPDIRAVYLC